MIRVLLPSIALIAAVFIYMKMQPDVKDLDQTKVEELRQTICVLDVYRYADKQLQLQVIDEYDHLIRNILLGVKNTDDKIRENYANILSKYSAIQLIREINEESCKVIMKTAD